jgi:SAM-dependent methyltransferase
MSLREHFDWVADNDAHARREQQGFHEQLLRQHRFHIADDESVLEWGCGAGALLAGLRPSRGLGIDLSPRMLHHAGEKYGGQPGIRFREGNIECDVIEEKFDHLVLNYLIGYLSDIQQALVNLQASAHARTRLHLTTLNTPWQFVLRLCTKFGRVMPQPASNWLSVDDLVNLLEIAGWEVTKKETLQLLPVEIPLISSFFNRFLVRLPLCRQFGITVWLTARPRRACGIDREISCSVIVPARNESGNIRAALERIPVLGTRTEIIFVEGNSKDDTWTTIQRETADYRGPHLVRAIQQPGKGKWDAVRTGFAEAQGAVLVVQDADLTAPPEDLGKFYDALVAGTAEFINGSRLVYPMEKRAMRFLNLLGNKFFAVALSFVLGQAVKDSLCGTKMLLRADYERLLKRIAILGDFDPFGDFNLLFGASLLNLRIRDLPVRYKDRTYGQTNISRFSHGWLLLKMTWFGLWNVKFPRLTRRRDE